MTIRNKEVAAAIKEFEDYASKRSDMGCQDTEPDLEFQVVIVQALKGYIQVPDSADSWQIYSSKSGASQVAKALTNRAQKVAQAIKKAMYEDDTPSELNEDLKDYCWRLSL